MAALPGFPGSRLAQPFLQYWRPAPGNREQLEEMPSEAPSAPNGTTAGNLLMQHLEGGIANWIVPGEGS